MCALHPKSRLAGHPRGLARGAAQLLGGVLGSRVVHESARPELDSREVLEAVVAPMRRGGIRKGGGAPARRGHRAGRGGGADATGAENEKGGVWRPRTRGRSR